VPLLKGQAVTLHAHCAREAGHISALVALLNAKTGERPGVLGWAASPVLPWLHPLPRCTVAPQGIALMPGDALTARAAARRRAGEVQRQRPRCLTKGQTALVEVTPARGLCLEEAADYRSLGRVALREGGRTIAVGLVTRILE
jgi:elongation factor 1 alpha-like protein